MQTFHSILQTVVCLASPNSLFNIWQISRALPVQVSKTSKEGGAYILYFTPYLPLHPSFFSFSDEEDDIFALHWLEEGIILGGSAKGHLHAW